MGFGQFFAGENLEALEYLKALAAGDGDTMTYLWGDSGCGKTHLLNASCSAAAKSGFDAVYLPMTELLTHGPALLEGMENHDLVCLDDMDRITGEADLEMAVFELFNRLRDHQRRLLVTACRPAAQLSWGLADLASRLSWGVTLRLRGLRDEEILEALQLKARLQGLELSDSVARYLMNHVHRDLSAMMALLEKLETASLVEQRRITIPFIKAVRSS